VRFIASLFLSVVTLFKTLLPFGTQATVNDAKNDVKPPEALVQTVQEKKNESTPKSAVTTPTKKSATSTKAPVKPAQIKSQIPATTANSSPQTSSTNPPPQTSSPSQTETPSLNTIPPASAATAPTYTGTLSVDKTSVTVTLDRNNAVGDLVFGSVFTISSQGATGWQIYYNDPTSGQGFYDSSGGINPGSSYEVRTYVNTSKPNGTYTGSAVVEYSKNGNWSAGPTVFL